MKIFSIKIKIMISFIKEKDVKPPLYYFEIPLGKKPFEIGIINVVAELEIIEHSDKHNSKTKFFSIKNISNIHIFDFNSNLFVNIELFIGNIFSVDILKYIQDYIFLNFDKYDSLK